MSFSPSYSGVIVIFMDKRVILAERRITPHYDYATTLCTHRRKALEDQKIRHFFNVNGFYLRDYKFDLCQNSFRHNLIKLLPVAFICNKW